MCGIAGWFSSEINFNPPQLLARMTDRLKHRGPDGAGSIVFPHCVLGHRRLSVIAEQIGAQPVLSQDGRYGLVFNGEIYNYLELATELSRHGIVTESSSDTSVLFAGLVKYGIEFVEHLNGQFAFAFYDSRANKLYLARDSFGEKPLYYFAHGGRYFFASEVKALLEVFTELGIVPKLAKQQFLDFLSLNYIPSPTTMIDRLYALKAGHYLEISDSGDIEGAFNMPNSLSSGDLLHTLQHALDIRLRADKPVGLFLSGGVDSTLLATLIAARQDANFYGAFTAKFSNSRFDESEDATFVAKQLHLRHEIITIPDDKDLLEDTISKLAYHADAPLADSSGIAFYLLSRAAVSHCKAVLTGDGGDELFNGYLTYRATKIASLLPIVIRSLLSKLAPFVSSYHSQSKVGFQEKLSRFFSNVSLPPGVAHFAWNAAMSVADKLAILKGDFPTNLVGNTFERLAMRYNVNLASPTLEQLMLADQSCYLTYDILEKADRAAMAHGLETRAVFLDPAVVAIARNVAQCSDTFFESGRKIVLRRLLKQLAPWYNHKPKAGFSVPLNTWLRGPLFNFADDIFRSKFVEVESPYNQIKLLSLWEAHHKEQRNLGYQLYGALISLIWMQRFGVKP